MSSAKGRLETASTAAKRAPTRVGATARGRAAKEPIARSARAKSPAAVRRVSVPGPKVLFDAAPEADIVDVPARTVLAIEGMGLPMGDAGPFQDAIAALYGVAYTLKFGRKLAGAGDFGVGAVEACWWADGDKLLGEVTPAQWRWAARLAVPDDVTDEELARALTAATRKGRKLAGSEAIKALRREQVPAMRMGRVLHRGPYDEEPRSLEKIWARLAQAQLIPARRHTEVYLNDPRRTKPENIKTVLLLECQ